MGYKINKKQPKPLEDENRPIFILVWGDSPACATGFATVIKNIFTPLALTRKYQIDIIGINDRGEWKDPQRYPFRVFPARNPLEYDGDFHGRPKLIAALSGKEPDVKPPWDIVFFLNDPFILEEKMPVFNEGTLDVVKNIQDLYRKKLPPESWFKTVAYWPVDSLVRGNWVEHSVAKVDSSIAYTEYAREEIDKGDMTIGNPTKVAKDMKIIYHGYNPNDFFVLDDATKKEFRNQFFEGRVSDDVFIVSAIARNQMRKDIPRTMAIFKEFQKRRPNSFLYIHAQESDAWGSLKEYARNWNLELGKDWGHPAQFSANTGFPVEAVNLLYNVSDCIISTSLGEGFGFYNFEAMATKTPLLAPNNTVHPELLGYDKNEDISDMETLYKKVRGVPMKAGSTSSEWATYGPQDLQRPRPLVNIDDAVKKLIWVYDNPDKVKEITDRAYDWVQQYTWDKIIPQWDAEFQRLYNLLKDERKQAAKEANHKSAEGKLAEPESAESGLLQETQK